MIHLIAPATLLLLFRDIAADTDIADKTTLLVEARPAADIDADQAAGPIQPLHLIRKGSMCPHVVDMQPQKRVRRILIAEQIDAGLAYIFRRRNPRGPLDLFGHIGVDEVGIGFPDPVGTQCGNIAEPLLSNASALTFKLQLRIRCFQCSLKVTASQLHTHSSTLPQPVISWLLPAPHNGAAEIFL
ncbi:hypothetical protein [Ferrovibrio terrae]|uniref:hypothetical protein n=1 Tax=Ferrovibrio terrae TaxID=2594003 RepID=UPI003137E87B